MLRGQSLGTASADVVPPTQENGNEVHHCTCWKLQVYVDETDVFDLLRPSTQPGLSSAAKVALYLRKANGC